MRIRRLSLILIPSLLIVAACGSSASTPTWATGADVLDSLKQAGIACPWTGTAEQVTSTNPITGEASKYPTVQCDDYGVVVVQSKDALIESIRKQSSACGPLTQEEVDTYVQSKLVLGDNFIIVPNGDFPETAQAADFIKAFGGEELTLVELYAMVCPDADLPKPS